MHGVASCHDLPSLSARLRFMRWAMYLDMKIVPMRFVSISSLAACGEVFCNSWNCAIPAALTRTSIWPVRF